MPWNPDTYNQFKHIRYQPFFDLAALVAPEGLQTAVDIGCGTGEQTALLAEKFDSCSLLGIDASGEMLAASKQWTNKRLRFQQSTIEAFAEADSQWDLLFSNSALHWSGDHHTLFPKLVSKINPGGQLAVQMPFQPENLLNRILLQLVTEMPFVELLQGFRLASPVLTVDDYAKILFACGLKDVTVLLKVYPIIAETENELYQFIAGSALIPYLERLDPPGQDMLKAAFIKKIRDAFSPFPSIYAFKRLLLYGKKS